MKTRRFLTVASVVVFAAATYFTIEATGSFDRGTSAASAATTCETKHCSPSTHCCYGCTGSPICVKNGVPCPECAPQ
jgi:hypothetical protein